MKYLITTVLLLLGVSTYAQKNLNPEFLNHLMNSEDYREVVFLIDKADFNNFNESLKDSLHYMKGWSLYSQKKLSRSANELQKVSINSPFYLKSQFFAAYNTLYQGNEKKAMNILDTLHIDNKNLNSLRHFEKAGINLINRNFKKFNNEFAQVDTTYYPLADESIKINQYATDLKNHQVKSPVLAGFMSSIIPGSGRIYAGETGEGISSFLTIGGLGLATWENYNKKGPKHFKTLFFGTIFTAFYIGNIYGTVFSVKIAEDEFQKEYDNKILFNLHIPLRNVFN
ncbi:MAG: hypothetical protein ACQESJ_01625 [Bacteroidota bacterium]